MSLQNSNFSAFPSYPDRQKEGEARGMWMLFVFFLWKQGARLGVVMIMPKGEDEVHPEPTGKNGAALCFLRSNVVTSVQLPFP